MNNIKTEGMCCKTELITLLNTLMYLFVTQVLQLLIVKK
jgi:hypothetical protein